MLHLSGSDAPITANELLAIEKRLNIVLPQEMKNLYLKFNGGQPTEYVHDDNYLYPIWAFSCLSEIEDDLQLIDENWCPNGFAPQELLPFAYNAVGGFFALSLRKQDFGFVYFILIEEKIEIIGKWKNFAIFLNSFIEKTQIDEN
ncbi:MULTISPECIES: SMI1/KNR4 family protein [Basfia]|uniref:Knr4/Smi1-like domain-containing protein n=2 Tax=Basfia TaxID=697331 RepID=Q65VI9_MANSM|nr:MULTISPECIES: SMI1/KNR4 family protein [Basfia]AAU37021.1 unknown [[Mannheimia] succiniciproducens MBEL55E]SCX79744.1 SMI1 / KNR4 family (SUKH-1) [Basfia succiniciproducens]